MTIANRVGQTGSHLEGGPRNQQISVETAQCRQSVDTRETEISELARTLGEKAKTC